MLSKVIIIIIVFMCCGSVSFADVTESINNYAILIGTSERNYSHKIVGWDIMDKQIINLPLIKDKPNFLCLKKRGSREHLSAEIVILYPDKKDTDHDGLSDEQELKIGSDPKKYDTDEDGLSDGEEWVLWVGKSTEDFDGDGLPNIMDWDSLDSGLSDKKNPDIETINKVVVIDDSRKKFSLLSFFNEEVQSKKIVINKEEYITFSWKPNNEKVDGYRIYYQRIDKEEEKHTDGLAEGISPIEVGSACKFMIAPPIQEGEFEFSVVAFIGNMESDKTVPIKITTKDKNGKIQWVK